MAPILHARSALESIYTRITMNRLTACFFLFGFLHCFAQGIMHSFLFSIDNEYNVFLDKVVNAAKVPVRNHTDLRGGSHNYRLEMCDWIPHNSDHCHIVFESGVDDKADIGLRDHSVILHMIRDGVKVTRNLADNSQNIPSVILQDDQNRTIVLGEQCTSILTYPQQHMHNAKREDLTFVIFQFWLFAISLIAMVYNSVPHILAGLGARILLTAWSGYALWRTGHQKDVYDQMIGTAGTPCSVDMFEEYFRTRTQYEIPDLILNCTGLIIFSYLSYALFKVYNTQSMKCVGAPDHINHIYKYFMAVQACLQLEVFVLITGMGLWIDQLQNSYIHTISEHTALYEALWIATTVLLLPWLAMGWYAIRREMRRVMILFNAIAFVFLFGWAMMFYSDMYRWTFYAWPNLGCYITASNILILATMVLGLICRMNFGKGLKQYLHAEGVLAASGFAAEVFDHDMEKHVTEKDAVSDLVLLTSSPVLSNGSKTSISPLASSISNQGSKSPSGDTAGELPTPTFYIPTLHSRDPSPELEAQHVSPVKLAPLRRQG